MKKIVFKEEVSEIHLSKVSKDSIILAKSEGKIIGIIVRVIHEEHWMCRTVDFCNESKRNLSDLLKWHPISNCEFYVLD
jgi:hypothetical protein